MSLPESGIEYSMFRSVTGSQNKWCASGKQSLISSVTTIWHSKSKSGMDSAQFSMNFNS